MSDRTRRLRRRRPASSRRRRTADQDQLSWTASTDNVACRRLPGRAVPGRRVHHVRPGGDALDARATSTLGLTASTSYSYRVVAVDASGNVSGYSLVASVSTPAAPPVPAGLVLGYSFDAGSGASVADVSGNGNTGSVVGCVVVCAGSVWRCDVVQWVEQCAGCGVGVAWVVGGDDVVGVDQSGGVAVGVAGDHAACRRMRIS